MRRNFTISDLDGFEDICNMNEFALTAGDSECKAPNDKKTWYEEEYDEQMKKLDPSCVK